MSVLVLYGQYNKELCFSDSMIRVGSFATPPRCTGTDTYYCKTEDLVEAKIEFSKMQTKARHQIDGYYSQPWV